MNDCIANLQLRGFEAVRWDLVLMRDFIEYECGCLNFVNSVKKIAGIFYPTVFEIEEYDFGDKPILFFQSFIDRKSSITQFDEAAKLGEGKRVHVVNKEKHRAISINKIKLLFSWAKEIRKCKCPIAIRISIINKLSRLYDFHLEDLLRENKYNLIVTFCDSYIPEGYLEEIGHLRGIKTATLQHGQFTSWRENKLVNSGVELRSIKSDYFLAWNQMTLDELNKTNFKYSRPVSVIVGILGNIGKQRTVNSIVDNNTFGVVIDHPFFKDNNEALIKYANSVAEHFGMNYVLKLHPLFDEHAFDNSVNKGFAGIVKKGIPIGDYASQVRFSLVGSSSVFVELVFVNHITIRYSNGDVSDKFKDVMMDYHFKNETELIQIIEKLSSNDQNSDALFSYLCGVENVSDYYLSFFKQFYS